MTRMPVRHILIPVAFVAATMIVSCGNESSSDDPTPATSAPPTTLAPTTLAPTTLAPTTVPVTTESTEPTEPTGPPTTEPPVTAVVGLEQPAAWPDATTVFATPEEAAADFVERRISAPPVLGEFLAGDSRSGEIEVFSPGDGGSGSSVARSLLLLRQLGPADGWFVLAAVQPMVSIVSPAQGEVVPAGPIEITGVARGFEATILVTASLAGSDELLTDPFIAMGGALETPQPYTATVDLSGVPTGSTVTIVVRGDTGLESDPGEFSAIALVVGD